MPDPEPRWRAELPYGLAMLFFVTLFFLWLFGVFEALF
jgi:hypothetical protein